MAEPVFQDGSSSKYDGDSYNRWDRRHALSSLEPRVTRHLASVSTLIVLAFSLVACASFSQPLPHRGAALVCGVERWPIKTLADQGASRVNLTPVRTSVDELLQLPV